MGLKHDQAENTRICKTDEVPKLAMFAASVPALIIVKSCYSLWSTGHP
jgi:hypothetical protein